MKILKSSVIATLLLAAVSVQAEAGQSSAEKFAMSASRSMVVTADVAAIDHTTRVVTLVGEKDSEYTFTASKEARNLDKVEVGDTVMAQYLHTISVRVVDPQEYAAQQAQLDLVARSAVGEAPQVEAVQAKIRVLTVTDINLDANTFKLADSDGVSGEYRARNPENLHKAAVGDMVVITDTQALALSVEPLAAE